jgi:hypothetical protein
MEMNTIYWRYEDDVVVPYTRLSPIETDLRGDKVVPCGKSVSVVAGRCALSRPAITHMQLISGLNYHGDCSYAQLPSYLKKGIVLSNYKVSRRKPTAQEMLDTIYDAQEHRVINNDLGFNDYKMKYLGGKQFPSTNNTSIKFNNTIEG